MLQGINIFDFFETKEKRRWNKADVKEYTVVFENGKIPPFIVVTETEALTASIRMVNETTNEATPSEVVNTTDSIDGYKIITFPGSDIVSEIEDGYYRIEITIAEVIYYSEVFSLVTNPYSLLKFEVYSEDITFAGVHSLPLSDINNIFYLFWNGISIESEIPEEGEEKPYGDIPLFSTLNIVRTASINGTTQIYRYLSALRIFGVNGILKITVEDEERQIYDSQCEIENDDSYGVTIQINFKYRELDFVSVKNEI